MNFLAFIAQNLTLFGPPSTYPHSFIPAGCSGCVQVGAGECSNEHEAKHLHLNLTHNHAGWTEFIV